MLENLTPRHLLNEKFDIGVYIYSEPYLISQLVQDFEFRGSVLFLTKDKEGIFITRVLHTFIPGEHNDVIGFVHYN